MTWQLARTFLFTSRKSALILRETVPAEGIPMWIPSDVAVDRGLVLNPRPDIMSLRSRDRDIFFPAPFLNFESSIFR